MKLNHAQLHNHLQKNLLPLYFISSDEPCGRQQAVTELSEAAIAAGFSEKVILHAGAHFDWQQLFDETQALSLFSDRKLIILHLPTGKPGTQGSKALQQYCETFSPDNLLIIVSGKIESAALKSKWVKALDSIGAVMQIWPLQDGALLSWIKAECQKQQLSLEHEGLRLLAERSEGNMLALQQAIEKLSLLYGSGNITYDQIATCVADSARYSVFELADHALDQNPKRTLKVVSGLQQEGTAPTLVLWALAREVRTMIDLAKSSKQSSVDQALRQARVWPKRQGFYKKALQAQSHKSWPAHLALAAECDQIIKGVKSGNAWRSLQTLSLAIAGVSLW